MDPTSEYSVFRWRSFDRIEWETFFELHFFWPSRNVVQPKTLRPSPAVEASHSISRSVKRQQKQNPNRTQGIIIIIIIIIIILRRFLSFSFGWDAIRLRTAFILDRPIRHRRTPDLGNETNKKTLAIESHSPPLSHFLFPPKKKKTKNKNKKKKNGSPPLFFSIETSDRPS